MYNTPIIYNCVYVPVTSKIWLCSRDCSPTMQKSLISRSNTDTMWSGSFKDLRIRLKLGTLLTTSEYSCTSIPFPLVNIKWDLRKSSTSVSSICCISCSDFVSCRYRAHSNKTSTRLFALWDKQGVKLTKYDTYIHHAAAGTSRYIY